MASVTILRSNVNLWIANRIAEDNGGTVDEDSFGYTVTARPRLEISRYSVQAAAGKDLSDDVWRSFTLNVQGRVTRASDTKIVIED